MAAWVKQQGITTSGIVFKDEYNFDNDEDVILDQSIEVGKKVKNDVKITFTISKGADPDEKVSVPDIKNMTKSEIESWIKENKLTKAKITTTYNETVEKDKVISYEVKGVDEADFTRSSTMNISVSKGPQPAGTVTVTDFKDKYYTEVESWAKTNKINLEKVEVYNDKVESGKVVSQSVAANKTMKQNETLTVTVSKGKGVKVPDIYKMNKEEIEALKELAKNSAKFLSLLKSKEDEKEELEEKELDKDVEEKIEEKEEVKKEINEEDTDASDEDDEDIEEEKEEEEVSEEEVIDVDSVDDSDSIVEDTMKKSFGSIESKKCPTGDSVENDEQALANIWAQRYKSK